MSAFNLFPLPYLPALRYGAVQINSRVEAKRRRTGEEMAFGRF